MFDLGARLRMVRQMHGLSQRELALRSGVNHSTLSLIEQNRTSPSVGLLKRALDGIPISLSSFFADEAPSQPEQIFFRRDELAEIGSGAISLRQVGTNLKDKALQIMHERFQPGADTGKAMLVHDGQEGGIVLRGSLEVVVLSERRVLQTGDAYYFDSRLPHRFRNAGDDVCEVVSACTPPTF